MARPKAKGFEHETPIEARRRHTTNRRDRAAKSGKCRMCCTRAVTPGLNPQLEPYRTCDHCRGRSDAAKANAKHRDSHREREYVYDPELKRCVLRTTSKGAPPPPDRFCVECQAHGFHRPECPALKPKKKRAPKAVELSWLEVAAAPTVDVIAEWNRQTEGWA